MYTNMSPMSIINMKNILLFTGLIAFVATPVCSKQINPVLETKPDATQGMLLASVPDIDLSVLSPSDFRDDELDLPYYLKHLHTLANGVVTKGPKRGFFDIRLYRSRAENIPGNARIMENILSLVFFYTYERPWNKYYGLKELKVRIEAAFDYLNTLQNEAGLYPDQRYLQGGMGATAFITKFIGEALVLLHRENVPAIDKDVLGRAVAAQRKAIMELLTNDTHYEHGLNYTNQYTNVYAGALAYLSVFDDTEMHQKLTARVQQSRVDFQSPVGFFYEGRGHGPDFSYNMNTSFSNLWMCYNYSRGTSLGDLFQKEAVAFSQWIKYNAVLEPNGETYILNRALASRTQYGAIRESWFISRSPFGESNQDIRAFAYSSDELNRAQAARRKSLEANWPNVGNLSIGSSQAYDPYKFLHRDHYTWHASASQKQAAVDELPYLKYDQFNHQKVDPKTGSVFTYLKRPNYYAAFASGPKATNSQRFGLTLLWNPKSGAFMQSIDRSRTGSWGTKKGDNFTYETFLGDVTLKVDGQVVVPVDGVRDLPDGQMTMEYAVGRGNTKRLTFDTNSIQVEIRHSGEFTEYIPLLAGDGVSLSSGQGFVMVTSASGDSLIKVSYGATNNVQIVNDVKAGNKRVRVLRLSAKDQLDYTISFEE